MWTRGWVTSSTSGPASQRVRLLPRLRRRRRGCCSRFARRCALDHRWRARGRTGHRQRRPGAVAGLILVIALVDAYALGASPSTPFCERTSPGFILIVVYVLAAVWCQARLHRPPATGSDVAVMASPSLALVMPGFTLYRNLWPLPGRGTSAVCPPVWRSSWLACGIVMIVSARPWPKTECPGSPRRTRATVPAKTA